MTAQTKKCLFLRVSNPRREKRGIKGIVYGSEHTSEEKFLQKYGTPNIFFFSKNWASTSVTSTKTFKGLEIADSFSIYITVVTQSSIICFH